MRSVLKCLISHNPPDPPAEAEVEGTRGRESCVGAETPALPGAMPGSPQAPRPPGRLSLRPRPAGPRASLSRAGPVPAASAT